MKDITKECYFRPRIYKESLSINIFFHDMYLGSIKNEGTIINREGGANGFIIYEKDHLFYVFADRR